MKPGEARAAGAGRGPVLMSKVEQRRGAGSGLGERPIEERTQEMEKWIERVELEGKHRILFELEILLKGLDRFFNISNLPLANMEQVITIDFNEEMEIVYQFVDRVVELSGLLLEASRRGGGHSWGQARRHTSVV